MGDTLYFNGIVTKSLQPINSEDRYFEGYLTVQVKDKQGEITIVDELYKVLPVWMDRGAPISDTHSNRIIGKGINYSKTEYTDKDGVLYPAIKITGKIHSNYELDNEIWNKIKSGEYKGLSFGGATKSNRTPVVLKDGSVAYELSNLEHYEVAVCKDPAVPLALITDFNPIAKSFNGQERADGKMLVRCTNFGCYIDKKNEIHENNLVNENMLDDIISGQDQKKKLESSEIKHEAIKPDTEVVNPKTKTQQSQQFSPTGERGLGSEHSFNQDDPKDTAQTTEVKDTNEDKESERDSEGKSDAENDGNNSGQYNQNVNEDSSSGRRTKGYENDGNMKAGQEISDNITNKNDEIYINTKNVKSDKNMVEEKPQEENEYEDEEKDEEEDEEEDENVEKSFQDVVKSNLDVITDVLTSLAETQKSVSSQLKEYGQRLKALEEPTDLPLKPATSATEDIGAKVKVPEDPYPQGQQSGLDDDQHTDDKPEKDHKDLTLETKGYQFSTETPRPSASVDPINKSFTDESFVLKDARSVGHEGLSQIAQNILKGKYYQPTQDEVGVF